MASRIFRLPHGWEGLPRLVLVFLLSLDDYAREVGKEVNNGFLFDSDYFTTGGVLQLAGYTPGLTSRARHEDQVAAFEPVSPSSQLVTRTRSQLS